ncbi:anti-sigma factor [Streptomyces sp. IBSBF 2806]|uniref:anti-sigma factor n=1 Tax=Streptomyces sp. IBSBF 2806 TaxID=2903529 RepID=UPI002FDBAF15
MTMQRDGHDELRARLHGAAEAHEPDRARILARVERGMAGEGPGQRRSVHRATRPPLWGWTRIVGATAAVAGMLAVGGYAVASAVKSDAPARQTVSVSPAPVDSPDATSRPPVSPGATQGSGGGAHHQAKPSSPPSKSAGASPSAPAATPLPAIGGTEDGPLRSDGSIDPHSNDFWAQSDVTLTTSEQLTRLTVQLKVAQTGGVSSTGAWRSLPEDDFTFTVAEQDGFLVYTWVLKEGRTVPKGEWVFSGQYNHDRGGRDARNDAYAISGRSDGRQSSVGGGFASRDDGH